MAQGILLQFNTTEWIFLVLLILLKLFKDITFSYLFPYEVPEVLWWVNSVCALTREAQELIYLRSAPKVCGCITGRYCDCQTRLWFDVALVLFYCKCKRGECIFSFVLSSRRNLRIHFLPVALFRTASHPLKSRQFIISAIHLNDQVSLGRCDGLHWLSEWKI